mmetsp:Transcript_6325/g.13059  ORF Transcript_6325/g.13059 Transcript_6325/m.13059 type:complete len:208 (+) Transcript_6325:905-1528(+)
MHPGRRDAVGSGPVQGRGCGSGGIVVVVVPARKQRRRWCKRCGHDETRRDRGARPDQQDPDRRHDLRGRPFGISERPADQRGDQRPGPQGIGAVRGRRRRRRTVSPWPKHRSQRRPGPRRSLGCTTATAAARRFGGLEGTAPQLQRSRDGKRGRSGAVVNPDRRTVWCVASFSKREKIGTVRSSWIALHTAMPRTRKLLFSLKLIFV